MSKNRQETIYINFKVLFFALLTHKIINRAAASYHKTATRLKK